MSRTLKTKRIPRVLLVAVVATLAASLLLAGCSLVPGGLKKPQSDQPPIPPKEKQGTAVITLYFADFQAQHVIPEEREVAVTGDSLAQITVSELLKGPKDPYLRKPFPDGLKLLSAEVKDGIAYVNFSSQMNQVQGSAGAAMVSKSLIHALTDLEGIDKVMILVEGQKWDMGGHGPMEEPAARMVVTYPVFIDPERSKWLQGLVDKGEQQWRLDPLEVARLEGRMAGFSLSDEFKLLSRKDVGGGSGTGAAEVEATHDGKKYIIQLIQPLGPGEKKIWAINSVREK